MIDVMHVIPGLGTGGAETMLVQLVAALQKRGFSQHVVSLSALDAVAADLRATGVDVTMLNTGSLLSAPAVMAALRRRVSELRPRVLQGWMYHGNIAATIAHYLCAGRRDRRLFWNLRSSNMDAKRYGRIIRIGALLVGLAGGHYRQFAGWTRIPSRARLHAQALLVIDNGIDSGKFRPDPAARPRLRGELGIPLDAIVVIHVARVDPMKDHATFISAMAQMPSLTGVMVGEGTQELTAPRNVRGLGRRRDTAALYAAADIVASTSAFGEGFSNAIAEGMSAGLLPVATDVGDARRIVGDAGFIVASRDPQAFVAALREVAALAEAERRHRGLAARDRIAANFTIERTIDAFAQLYAA